jgi:hypothetical protein
MGTKVQILKDKLGTVRIRVVWSCYAQKKTNFLHSIRD